MAHTLILTDGTTSVTLSIASGTVGAFLGNGDSGSGYRPASPIPDVSYSASLYRDSQRPRYSRYANVMDEMEVTVSEASADAIYLTIRNIKKLLWKAKDYFENPMSYAAPVYLQFQPNQVTNISYSTVFGGYVEEDILDDSSLLSGLVKLRIKIEREAFWREYKPYAINHVWPTPQHGVIYGGDNSFMWGYADISGVKGDIPALGRIVFSPRTGSGLTVDKVVFSYRSKRQTSDTGASHFVELENFTMGTDSTATADATASPGGAGNTRVTTTFATKTDSKRLSYQYTDTGTYRDKYRVFLRCKCSSANTVTTYFKWYVSNPLDAVISAARTTTPVSFTNTDWAMVDLGVVNFETYATFDPYYGHPVVTQPSRMNFELYASASTTADVYFDFLCFMPCDEYYLTMTGLNSTGYRNFFHASTIEPNSVGYPVSQYMHGNVLEPSGNIASNTAIGTGAIYVPPGDGIFTWMSGDSSWKNTYSASYNCWLRLYATARYLSVRGNT